jgi:hypothetical protein
MYTVRNAPFSLPESAKPRTQTHRSDLKRASTGQKLRPRLVESPSRMQRATGEKQQNGTATGIFELQCSSSAPAEEGRCNATNAPRSVHTARNNPTLRPKKLDHSPAPQPVSVSAQNIHDKGALTKHHQPGFRIVTTGFGP